jgi:sporadic carbohydrate cluster protein (TIGR04323 family)
MRNIKYLNGYIFVREFFEMSLPTSTQHLVMKKYCDDYGYFYKLADQELIMKNSFITLNSLIKKVNDGSGIIMCSLHMLPKDNTRKKFLLNMIKKKIQVHFVFEKFILKDNNDVNNLENFIKLNNIINNYDYRNINFLKKIKVIN